MFAAIQKNIPALKKASEFGLLYYAKTPEPLPTERKIYDYRHEPVDLLRAMLHIYSRGGKASPPDMSNSVPRRIVYSVRDKSAQILTRLKQGKLNMDMLYQDCASRSEIGATFVSVLELCSIGSVMIDLTDGCYELSFVGGEVEEILEKIIE